MIRIKIDSKLKDEANTFCNLLFSKRGRRFVQPVAKLTELRDRIRSRKHIAYKNYVQRIIDKYVEILKADPDEMGAFINEFRNDFPSVDTSELIPRVKMRFHDAIVAAMRYEDLRDQEFLDYLKTKSYKACVYCNSNATLIVDFKRYHNKDKIKTKSRKARLELDHFYPKSKYPFLCTSFFNLYPVCGNCNRSKSNKTAKFQLYTKDDLLDSFVFWIDDVSIVNYWKDKTRDCSKIKVCFQSSNGDLDLLSNHDELFQIQGIIDCYTDLAEELLHKAKVYNNSYKESLVNSFKALFPDQTIINRLLIGNYDRPEDIHKRPMAKFTQDVAKQLGLI